MPRPTPHGRRAGGPRRPDGTKNRWSNDRRAATGRKPRNTGEAGEVRDQRQDQPREDLGVRRDDAGQAPRTSDMRGRNFEAYRPQREERGESRGFRREERGQGRDDRGFRRDDRQGGFGRDDRRQGGFSRDDREGGFRREDRDGGFRREDRDGGFRREDRRQGGFGRDDRREGGFRREEREGGFRRDDRDRGPRRDFRAARPVNEGPRPKWEPRAERRPWERGDGRDEHRRSYSGRDRLPADERSWRDERDGGARREDRGFRRDERQDNRDERRSAWGRPEQRDFREQRREDHRGPRGGRDQRFGGREDAPDSENPDVMSWTATELGDIDESVVHEGEGFAALGVPTILVAALDKQGITSPFPIQAATIPDAIAGRDVLGRGQTGSGKTLGFGLPMLTRIPEAESTGGAPRGLVLVPTRELALQCADVLAPLAKALKLDLTLIAGGMGYGPQLRAFERGVDVVVATPGRLIDLLEQGAVDLSQVLVTVLDEADHMADLGFMPAVTTLLDTVPADGQRLLFSATLDHAVDRIVKKYLHDPVTHEVDSDRASVSTMEHHLLQVAPHEKNQVTAEIANRQGRTVVFARTQMGATRIANQLREAGVMAGALHGGLTQGARTRILAAFKEGTVPVLVATDVAARGIHVDDVSLVLEVDPPMNSKDYLHRAGRTARAGEKGVVASIVLPHQRKTMARITGQAGVKAEPQPVRPGSDELAAITGSRPTGNAPIEEAEYEALIAPRKQVRGPRAGGARGFGGRGRGGYRGQGGDRRQGGGYRGQGGRRAEGRGADGGWHR